MAPRIALGIVTRDRAAVLPRSIDSALAQTNIDLHIWVVNDGSIDQTADLAARYPTVDWVNWPNSRGYVAARNYLMNQVDADYYVSLDDDAWFICGDEIAASMNYLQNQPDVGVAAFDIVSADKPDQQERGEPTPCPTFIGCGHAVRLAAIRKVGGYESAPGGYGGEEKDLSLRLMDAGYKIMLMPGVHVWHDKTPAARDLIAQHSSGVCNDFVMTFRRTPLIVLPAAFLAKLYRHFRFSHAHRMQKSFWRGLRLFVRSVPQLWKSRRPVRLATLRAYLKLT